MLRNSLLFLSFSLSSFHKSTDTIIKLASRAVTSTVKQCTRASSPFPLCPLPPLHLGSLFSTLSHLRGPPRLIKILYIVHTYRLTSIRDSPTLFLDHSFPLRPPLSLSPLPALPSASYRQTKMSQTSVRGIVSGFDPLQGLSWTAETKVQIIKDLVRDRETLFARHRGFNDCKYFTIDRLKIGQIELTLCFALAAPLQLQSERRVKRLVDRLNTVFKSSVKHYEDFCQALHIPTYPVTFATIALFLFAKCSLKNGDYKTNYSNLKRIRKETGATWKYAHGEELSSEEPSRIENAIREFQKERVAIKARAGELTCPLSLRTADGASLQCSLAINTPTPGLSPNTAKKAGSESEGDESQQVEVEQLVSALCLFLPRPLANEERQPTRGLPQPEDRFDSKEELLAATYLALLPIYGIGARLTKSDTRFLECSRSHSSYRSSKEGMCGWRIGFQKDKSTGEMIVTKEGSNLSHNHGPAPRLLEDSNWRPTIKNKLVRQRLGMGKLISNKRVSPPLARTDCFG